MWLILSNGSTFNLNTARAIRVGAAGGTSDEWALLAEMPNGEDIVLAEFHSPQGAQKTHDEVIKALKTETRMLDLS